MSTKHFAVLLSLLVVFSMLLVACGGEEGPVNNESANEPANEPADEPVDEPRAETSTTTRKGGWLDTIALSVVNPSSAVTQIKAGAIDIYGGGLSTPQDFQAIVDAGLEYAFQYGLYYEITFNPAGDPTFEGTGALNPFSSIKVREAMNWLIDRDYINQEIYGGQAIPKFFSLVTGFPEYGRYIDLIRPYEIKYAPNHEKAVEAITEGMTEMGAEMVDGLWTYNGEPVELTFLIRTDGDGTRKPMGDIISVWLEEVGFTVNRQYGTSSGLAPLWVGGNVDDGLWNMYTGGWGAGAIARDNSDDFDFFLSPRSAYGFTSLWQAYDDMTEDELDLFSDLANRNFKNLEERHEMFAEALDVAMKYSYRVWVVDGRIVSPWRPDMQVSYDLSLYPFTMRFDDQEGGTIRMGQSDLFVDPANPIAGSNWSYDAVWQLPTQDYDAIPNPYTGVQLPQRLERAEVVVQTGLPVGQTYDWVSLDFADEIVPPDDAWVDFDVVNEVFLTVADWKDTVATVDAIQAGVVDTAAGLNYATLDTDGVLVAMETVAGIYTVETGNKIDFSDLVAEQTAVLEPPEDAGDDFDPRPLIEIRLEGILAAEDPAAELTDYALEWLEGADTANLFGFAARDFSSALRKVTYYYPSELWDVTWHDGSSLSMGDFVMPMIMPYAMGRQASELFDSSQASTLEAGLTSFKGQKIISTDPLVIELYSDTWYADAEQNAVLIATAFWPNYGFGQSSWAMIAVGNLAERDGELAYSSDKADANEIEWANWIGGPSLEILAAKLDEAIAENYIPFEPTLGQYVTADEAAARYANLKAFYEEYGHFWSGTGPYVLDDVFLVEKNATLTYNPNYMDPADKWAMFLSTPRIADVAVDGPGRVTIGEEATFDVFVTFEGESYPADDVAEMKYLLFDAQSNLVEVGAAELVEDGYYTVTLSADATAQLEAGANKLEVVSIVIPVSIPSIGGIEFVIQ